MRQGSRRQKTAAKLVLHTSLAKRVFKGQWRGPVGLQKFAALTRSIWCASQQNDPYADLFLFRIYDRLVSARKQVQSLESHYLALLRQHDGVEAQILVDQQPDKLWLSFTTPYSFMAAYLLADFDRLVRVLVALNHYGLLVESKVMAALRSATRLVRRILSMPLLWRQTGVTRANVLANDALAQQAKLLMGEINEQILQGQIKLPFSPPSQSLASATQKPRSKANESLQQARS